jgi:hypothetical protein
MIENQIYNTSSHAFTPKPSYASGTAHPSPAASKLALLPDAQKSNDHCGNGAAAHHNANGAAA